MNLHEQMVADPRYELSSVAMALAVRNLLSEAGPTISLVAVASGATIALRQYRATDVAAFLRQMADGIDLGQGRGH
ncbi:hypothetical protein [Sphingosinicella microcystinivorans]|uniref:hypothetical protein n=1 Tax=Sphingosinicella microcystinivorans TaxID=335406 RepID=UPI0022F3CCFE|nr:hypothetical protein [Sphingosinicella microcystinivorans]WBX83008.1 hypothetical protein PE061_14470 [Sphingosinicella microcystinivorans]